MLFNSFAFLFGFLPITLVLFRAASPNRKAAKLVLTLLSLAFYAYWRPEHIIILLWSILFNYFVGARVQQAYAKGRSRAVSAWLLFGIIADLALLGWFKYANFVAENLNAIFGTHYVLAKVALPLAISFFTFQKLAYLIDSARGEAQPMSFLDFSLFASFFPQLIAGPIVHYREVVPQFQRDTFGRLIGSNLMVGLVIFAIGLFKKTVIADTLTLYADPLFVSAAKGAQFDMLTGWGAAVTFTFQLYFDFSGYSDMAIGLARMFGVKLPLNFHSPLRASNIIDYWRRWHMTLQRFIVAYIFQPLSLPLSRIAAERGFKRWPAFAASVIFPSFVTFVVVGIWHGAGWTFVLFGVMHAFYICVNQYWRERRLQKRQALRKLKRTLPEPGALEKAFAHALTLTALLFSNVMFRAADVGDAFTIWRGMVGMNHSTAASVAAAALNLQLAATLAFCVCIVFLTPNTQQIMRRFDPACNWREWRDVALPVMSWTWRPALPGLLFVGAILFFGIMFIQRGQAVFLYFNF